MPRQIIFTTLAAIALSGCAHKKPAPKRFARPVDISAPARLIFLQDTKKENKALAKARDSANIKESLAARGFAPVDVETFPAVVEELKRGIPVAARARLNGKSSWTLVVGADLNEEAVALRSGKQITRMSRKRFFTSWKKSGCLAYGLVGPDKAGSGDDAEEIFALVLEMEKHSPETASKFFRVLAKTMPENAEFLVAYAENIAEKDPARAISLLKRAAALKPNRPRYWKKLASVQEAAGREKAAAKTAGKSEAMFKKSSLRSLVKRLREPIKAKMSE